MTIADFDSIENAFEQADRFIARNKAEFGHNVTPMLDSDGDPLMDRFYYVQGKGLNKTWGQKESQVVSFKPKGEITRKALEGVTSAMELLGENGGQKGVKDEHEAYKKLSKEIEALKNVEW